MEFCTYPNKKLLHEKKKKMSSLKKSMIKFVKNNAALCFRIGRSRYSAVFTNLIFDFTTPDLEQNRKQVYECLKTKSEIIQKTKSYFIKERSCDEYIGRTGVKRGREAL